MLAVGQVRLLTRLTRLSLLTRLALLATLTRSAEARPIAEAALARPQTLAAAQVALALGEPSRADPVAVVVMPADDDTDAEAGQQQQAGQDPGGQRAEGPDPGPALAPPRRQRRGGRPGCGLSAATGAVTAGAATGGRGCVGSAGASDGAGDCGSFSLLLMETS